MESLDLVIYFCLVLPLIPIISVISGRKSKMLLLFLLIGITVSLVSAQVNSVLVEALNYDLINYSTTIAPLIEELFKLIPLLVFWFGFSKDDDDILALAFVVGIGFAIYESILMIFNDMTNVSILWSLTRGIGAQLMHSTCTAIIASGLKYVKDSNKSFIMGTIGLYSMAAIYHGTFNAFAVSDYMYISLIMPIALFIPINYIEYKNKKTSL